MLHAIALFDGGGLCGEHGAGIDREGIGIAIRYERGRSADCFGIGSEWIVHSEYREQPPPGDGRLGDSLFLNSGENTGSACEGDADEHKAVSIHAGVSDIFIVIGLWMGGDRECRNRG